MEWERTATAQSSAAPEAVWRVLIDGPRWNEWNPNVEWMWIETNIVPGALATIKPKGIRQTAFVIESAVPQRHLVFRLTIGPVAIMRGAFTLEPDGEGTHIEMTTSITGPAAGFLLKKSAEKIAAAMPENLERLATQAAL